MTTPNPWPGNADQPSTAPWQNPAPWAQNPQVQPPFSTAQKSKVTALILVIFVGSLGVHNFYLGHTGKGIAQLSLTVIGWITSFLLVGFLFLAIVGIWVLIELIQIATGSSGMHVDADGIPLV